MDALCLNAGIHGIAPPVAAAGNLEFRLSAVAEKPSVSAAPPRNLPWGFTFRHPLRSFWPGSKTRFEPAIAVDDAVLGEEKEVIEETELEKSNENWVFKILHVRSLWKEGEKDGKLEEEMGAKLEEEFENAVEGIVNSCGEDEECDLCSMYEEDDDEEKIEFDRESFSKLLRKVPLAEARLYSKLSYLGSLAYCIPEIKPGNLLRHHGVRFVTSSLEKKEQRLKLEKEKESSEKQADADMEGTEQEGGDEEGKAVTASAAYRIAASAASYLQSHTLGILRSNSSKSRTSEDMMNDDVASLMATTDSVTAVVAAKEEVKQAVADDLNSNVSSPCEWFICDDDKTATRLFVIQGSESMASWQANLLFEPIQFEGFDVLVHRGIYEAAKGIYEQMLPEIHAHLKSHGDGATFRFTGHSLGGSLSVLVNLMLLIRGEVPRSSLLPVITFGAPSIMCGGDCLLRNLRLPKNHVRSVTMHRDIVPRAFSCSYPNHVAEFLKAVNGNFRNHPCLNKQKLLYTPMGELLILQPDDKFSPGHNLLPPGSGLYFLACPEKQLRAAQGVFLNSPHPLEILSDPSAYGSEGTIQRDHDMNSYLKSVKNVIGQELNRIRKAKRDLRRKVWWPLVAPGGANGGVIVGRPIAEGNFLGQSRVKFSGVVKRSRESLKRFGTLVASQHMHLLVVLLLPASIGQL